MSTTRTWGTLKGLDELAKAGGFRDEHELQGMVARLTGLLARPGMAERFLRWGREDGSKDGLQALLDTEEEA